MKKILISIIIFSFLLCGCQKTTPLSHKEFCLDTIVQITLYDSSSKNILNNCFNLCKKYELVFSANNKESELYKINHAHHKLDEQPLSKELFKVIKEGLYYSQLSQGAFDITIGSVSSLWNFKENKLPDDQQIKAHLNDISYQNIILDNQKLEIPFEVEFNKVPEKKDYYKLCYSETEIDIDQDGKTDTFIYSSPFINTKIKTDNILYIDGENISKEGTFKKKVYMTIEIKE